MLHKLTFFLFTVSVSTVVRLREFGAYQNWGVENEKVNLSPRHAHRDGQTELGRTSAPIESVLFSFVVGRHEKSPGDRSRHPVCSAAQMKFYSQTDSPELRRPIGFDAWKTRCGTGILY